MTNPTGGNGEINSGIVQRRIFPNEEGFYRLRVAPEQGTKVNAVIPQPNGDMLVLKDRGVCGVRITNLTGAVIVEPTVFSSLIGCSTFKGYARGDHDDVYFAGYNDCYYATYNHVEPLVEKSDKRDWLYTYREVITNAQKESATVIFLPQGYVLWDFGQVDGNQYVLDNGGWSQAKYNAPSNVSQEFFRWPTKLANGTTIVIGTPAGGTSTLGIRIFQNPTTGAFFYTDNGTPIAFKLDSDYFTFGLDKDFVFSKLIFSRTVDAPTSGFLDVSVYTEGVFIRTYGNLDKTKQRVYTHSMIGDRKVGNQWRFIYNVNSNPEVMTGIQNQLDGIEIYGDLRNRNKRATDVVGFGQVAIFDQDKFDSGKVFG